MIDTIVFDLGNVLVDFCWEKAFKEVLGLSGETFERVANATTRHEDWNLHDKGDLTDEDMLKRFISNDPGVENEIKDLYSNLSIVIEPFDYAKDWIVRLKKAGYKVYILSNYSRKAFREGRASGKLSFVDDADGAVISYMEHLIKPDPAIFKLLFERYSINPDSAVFIDDREDNIEIAIKCGMKGIVCRNREQVFDDLNKMGVNF